MSVGVGRLAVILPVLNEAAHIRECLVVLQPWRAQGHMIILVDGGSQDGTVELASPWVDQVVHSAPGRAVQMNAGAAVTQATGLIFLHADTRLPEAAPALVVSALRQSPWGRFDVRLSGDSFMYRLIATGINLRSRWSGVATGDQALFMRRDLFLQCGGFAPIPLMEDVELTSRLRRYKRPVCVKVPAVTDSRRWQKHGTWRTITFMWRLRWAFWRGADPAVLAKRYYPSHVIHPTDD